MRRAISICNQKGGVGKSTTAVNVGAFLATEGRKILLVDLDPQGNATTACGINRSQVRKTAYDVLIGTAKVEEARAQACIDRLHVLPSSFDLAGADLELSTSGSRETILKRALEGIKDEYDLIIFDCPPSLGLLTVNALVASDSTIVPVQCEYLALEGLNALVRSIEMIKQTLNPELSVAGIVLTMADHRANLTREVIDEVRGFFKELVFKTVIPRNVRLAEAPSFGKPICLYDAGSAGATAYESLATEVAERVLGQSVVELATAKTNG